MNFLLKSVNLKPDGWLWHFPHYYIVMFLLVLIAIALLIITMRRSAKNSAKLDILIAQLVPTICPCCHEETLVTVRQCTSPKCRSIMILKDKKHSPARAQHASGD